MFNPTTFPCTAWYVTPALNVLQTTVNTWCSGYGVYDCKKPGYMREDQLFETRAGAVTEAVLRLAEDTARLRRAEARHARRKKMVDGLLAGGASA